MRQTTFWFDTALAACTPLFRPHSIYLLIPKGSQDKTLTIVCVCVLDIEVGKMDYAQGQPRVIAHLESSCQQLDKNKKRG